MKVFFTASLRGRLKFGQYYKVTRDYLEKLGYDLMDYDVTKQPIRKFYQELDKGGIDARKQFSTKVEVWINKANLCIFDCSLHSSSIGFITKRSLELEKPTIIIYLKGYDPYYLEGLTNDHLIVKEYTKNNIKRKLKEALEEAKQYHERRFNFFISSKILSAIGQRSKSLGMSKSAYMRGLIISDLKNKLI